MYTYPNNSAVSIINHSQVLVTLLFPYHLQLLQCHTMNVLLLQARGISPNFFFDHLDHFVKPYMQECILPRII